MVEIPKLCERLYFYNFVCQTQANLKADSTSIRAQNDVIRKHM